jgi:hypothetical protein
VELRLDVRLCREFCRSRPGRYAVESYYACADIHPGPAAIVALLITPQSLEERFAMRNLLGVSTHLPLTVKSKTLKRLDATRPSYVARCGNASNAAARVS